MSTIMINVDETNYITRGFLKELRNKLEDIYQEHFSQSVFEFLLISLMKIMLFQKQLTTQDFENEIKEIMDDNNVFLSETRVCKMGGRKMQNIKSI